MRRAAAGRLRAGVLASHASPRGARRVSLTDAWKIPTAQPRVRGLPGAAADRRPRHDGSSAGCPRAPSGATCAKPVGSAEENVRDAFFWRRRLPEPEAGKPVVVDYALLRELFRACSSAATRSTAACPTSWPWCWSASATCGCTASRCAPGARSWSSTRGAGQPAFDVPAPFLSAEDMLAVREHLSRLLQADFAEGDLLDLQASAAAPEAAPEA